MSSKYEKSVAYFSMEIAIDQTLKTYSGGLGFLAGSHMRSAYELKQNLVGVTMLWKYGYYDQVRSEDFHMEHRFIQKYYSFLKDTEIIVDVNVNGHTVKVKAFYLEPEIFGTAPIYFLTTDIEENDYLSRTITSRLYDSNTNTRMAQEIVLGIGGAKILEQVGEPEIYHMNEAHPLPLAFYQLEKLNDIKKVQDKIVFTTHTPEKAGNSSYPYLMAEKMGYLSSATAEHVKGILGDLETNNLECTAAALKLSKICNAVSQLHAEVAKEMWKDVVDPSHIIGITNSQNANYWQDTILLKALEENNDQLLLERKKELKRELFKEVANQEGDLFDENILTIVWARRFTAYKRPELILRDFYEFVELVEKEGNKVQMIWAGKPHPNDKTGTELFNSLIDITYSKPNCAVLVGYELELSAKLKKGADIWLNTPKITREASGTSGMTAAMNGAINFSINDGWIPEFEKDGENCFLIPSKVENANQSEEWQAEEDYKNLMDVLKNKIIPTYYKKPEEWVKIMKNSMKDISPAFESSRMAAEYYDRMYNI